MDFGRIHKKLAEAQFFLGKMTEQEHSNRTFGDRQRVFDFYLSAFLNAAMSVRGGFHYRQNRMRNQAIKEWRARWENNLSPQELSLYEFMVDDRNDEVHESGSSRTVGEKGVPLPVGRYQSRRDSIFVSDDVVGSSSPNLIFRPSYSFTIDGADCEATEACRKYLALLQRMVAEFEADHP